MARPSDRATRASHRVPAGLDHSAGIPRAWSPIDTAAKDETQPILVYFDHDADPYRDPADPNRLTNYAAIAEGGDFLGGEGIAIAVWRDGYHDSDGWEAANSYWVPGGWFAWLDGDAADQVCNALFWQPLPEPPVILEAEHA